MIDTPLTPEVLVPRVGEYLVEKGLISEADLDRALDEHRRLRDTGQAQLIGQVLIDMGLVTRQALDAAVTEQIRALHSALVEANAQLEKRVQERTAELQVALKKLSELNQLKSNIISNVSHELRTPLTHIKGYMELLNSESLGPLTGEQISALRVMQKSGERLEQLIEDMIRFSLASRGEFTLQPGPVDLHALCGGLLMKATPKAIDHQVTLVCEVNEHLPRVNADEEKITWVMMQLLDNAIKFTPPGGTVSIGAQPEGGLCQISVQDTGIGIPAERYVEIFEPFHQLDGASTRRYGGTGLGLALVKQIIDAHGTSIQVVSAPSQGTRFSFLLPFFEGQPAGTP